MRTPIQRIVESVTPDGDAYIDALRRYVIDAFAARLSPLVPDGSPSVLVDAAVYPWGSYYDIKVFVSDRRLVSMAEDFAPEMEDRLADEGIRALLYVHSWTVGGQP